MNLPTASRAQVDKKKVAEYLLSSTHRGGRGKAAFFWRFGFSTEQWGGLADALIQHGQKNNVAEAVESRYGTTSTVEGPLETPDGRRPRLRTVWIVEAGASVPRLVTAYPLT